MAFIPPPAGVAVPSDDWSDDPSFDLDPSETLHTRGHSPRSSNASISSSSSSRISTSSPLRHVHTAMQHGSSRSGLELKKKREEEVDDLGDDFLDDEEEAFSIRTDKGKGSGETTKSAPKKMGTIGLTGTVMGMGPKGVGTITRLGGGNGNNASPILAGTVKARAKAIEKGWERDLDLDDWSGDLGGRANLLELGQGHKSSSGVSLGKVGKTGTVLPPSNRTIASANALDDLDFDDFGQEEEDQATLKAGATIKAMLPPPRSKVTVDATIRAPSARIQEDDFDLESDLVLPLSMTNLTLVTQSQTQPHSRLRSTQQHLRPRTSTSTIGTDWDSPSPSSGSSKKDSTSPSPWNKSGARQSETSGTSVDLEVGTPIRKGRAVEVEVEGEEEGEEMMLGLILPEPTFFAGMREGELNKILDKKRKPQFGGVPNVRGLGMGWQRPSEPEQKGSKGDESMEDGLLFEDPGRELTGHRLRQQRKVRGLGQGGIGTIRKGGNEGNRQGSGEKSREAGWGRHTPLPNLREKERTTQNIIPALGHRSHSASASPLPVSALPSRDFSSASAMAGFPSLRRPESSHAINRDDKEREPPRTRTQSVMAPPPIPSTPSSRLRHQKSHYQLPPMSPSPTLARKQSLASLQDALTHPIPTPTTEERRTETPHKERYHASTSRLTMATSSSRAKARPPISAIFPRSEIHTPTASTSSTSISGLSRGPVPKSGHIVQAQSQMVLPLGGRRRAAEGKKRTWGDGTELEGIEDLEVDEPSNSRISATSGSGGIGLGRPSKKGDSLGRSTVPPKTENDKRKKSEGKGSVSKRKTRKTAGLIKHLGGVDKKKVVGDMTWNPSTLRWEGNESILREFDTIPSNPSSAPARPALITHYTGGLSSPSTSNTATASASASTIRIVGDMKFDPERMCWVSIGEEELDPFADMADDEDELGGTITRSMGRKLVSIGGNGALGVSAGSSRLASESSAGGSTWNWEERVKMRELDNLSSSSPADQGEEITEELWKECKEAEERHKKEMKGWGGLGIKLSMGKEEISQRERREEKRLWEIRYLAMRS